jgi:hypothetical protein
VRAIKTTTISILAVGLLAGSAIGVAAQDDEVSMAPGYVVFTDGVEAFGPASSTNPVEVTANDSRASGSLQVLANQSQSGGGEDYVMLSSDAVRLTNDAGAWTGTGDSIFAGLENRSLAVWSLTGDEAYDGLTLYVVLEETGEFTEDGDSIFGMWGVIAPSGVKPTQYPPMY